MSHTDLERLAVAGLLDLKFRELLLRDPLRASRGYYGERFHLTREERALLASIHTCDFRVFVEAIADWIARRRAESDRRLLEGPSAPAAPAGSRQPGAASPQRHLPYTKRTVIA